MSMAFDLNRLRWKCRRGLLELDLILQKFLDSHFSFLSIEQQADFDRLLDEQDYMLQSWLLSISKPEDEKLQLIIDLIKSNS